MKKLISLLLLILLFVGFGLSANTIIDDFEDEDISEYSGDTGSFSVTSGAAQKGSFGLEVVGSGGPAINHRISSSSGLNYYPKEGDTLKYYINSENPSDVSRSGVVINRKDNNNKIFAGLKGENLGVESMVGGTWDGSSQTTAIASANTWYYVKIDWTSDSYKASLHDLDGNKLGETSLANTQSWSSEETGWILTHSNYASPVVNFDTSQKLVPNQPPVIENQEILWNDVGSSDLRKVNYSISDPDGLDIASHSSIPSGSEETFTNSTYTLTGVNHQFDYLAEITDFAGVSDSVETNFTLSDLGYREDDYSHSLGTQRVNLSANIENLGAPANYSLSLSNPDSYSSIIQGTSWAGNLTTGETVSRTGVWEGDWITGVYQRSFSKYQSASFDHDEDTQVLVNRTELVADNEQSVEFTDVNVSSVCSQTGSTNVLPGNSVSVTTDCNRPTFEVDFIDTLVGSQKQDLSKAADLQTQYLEKVKNVSETGGYSWSSVTIFAPSIDGSCSDCSNREKDINAGEQISETYHSSSDWITGETENDVRTIGENSSGSHDLGTQYILNETELIVENTQAFSFTDVVLTGRCENTASGDIAPGTVQVTDNCSTVERSGDWITGETVSSFEKYASSEFDHSEDKQRLVNRTQLTVDNQKSFEFTEVNISSRCSNTGLTDVGPGTEVTATTNCSTPAFTVDFIHQSISDLVQDDSYNHNLSSQSVVREKQLSETGGYNWSSVNVSSPEMPGSCEYCGQRKLDVEANSTTSTFYNSTGDWVQEQIHNTSYEAGQVIYGGGIEKRFNATQQVYTNNTRSGVGFDVDFTEAISQGLSNCRLVNNTVQSVPAGHSGNHSFVKSCNPGQEVGYTPVQKTDLGGKYKYNLTSEVEVLSELTSEQEHWIGIPQTRLDKWEDRDPGDTDAYVDGQSSEVRVEQGVVNGTEYVFIVVSDEFGQSSLHTGEHTATLIYTEGGDSSTGTRSPGQIGDPIGEVEGEDYSWGLYNVRSQEQEEVGFSIAGVPGRQFERRLAVRNKGDQPVTLELECVSQGEACDWVETSVDRIQLDTQDNSVSYFDVSGRVPTTAEADDTYRFSIRVSDPSFEESNPSTSGSKSADFVVSISPFFGTVIENIQKLLSWRDIEPPEWAPSSGQSISYPFAALPLFSSISMYALLGLLQRRYSLKVSNYDEIGKFAVAFLVFLVVTGIA